MLNTDFSLCRATSLTLCLSVTFDHCITDTDLKIKTLVLHECPLWKNPKIERELTGDEIRLVMDDFISSGHGEWEDPQTRTRCRILWRKPEQLASDIYDWAVSNGYVNSVCTVFELHSGEFHHESLHRYFVVIFIWGN
mmetsp:Transcript_5899/g.12463  ORF Transcript_5899/g.12463 Transcript_5899/m.12463 type:complete len:138 (+) Transcript_5899:303-716(+)